MMSPTLLKVLQALCEKTPRTALQKAAEALSLRYRTRQNQNISFIQTNEEALAYLSIRFPATYAVSKAIYQRFLMQEEAEVGSFLDIGSGAFSSFFAAHECFSQIDRAYFIEKDLRLLEMGKKLLKEVAEDVKPDFRCEDFTKVKEFPSADLVVFSYSIGEVVEASYKELLSKAVKATQKYILIVEPGTPYGFERILKIREELLSLGLYVVAPCPHAFSCPIPEKKWCHFSERLPRTALHKFLKGGDVGYEDEKYSYLLFSKELAKPYWGRITSHLDKKKGFLNFEVCQSDGQLVHQKVLKRNEDSFALCKKLDWGDNIQKNLK